MNVLYFGKYKQRFTAVIEELKHLPENLKITELCFGDIYIAKYCKQIGYSWKGIDINLGFVNHAKKLGYDAYQEDLTSLKNLPKSDLCIMIGSLYHFHPDTEGMLSKMFDAADTVILSEPVSNLSDRNGLVGYLARRSANAGKGHEKFRYNESSLLATLNSYCDKFNCKIISSRFLGKDLLVKLQKK